MSSIAVPMNDIQWPQDEVNAAVADLIAAIDMYNGLLSRGASAISSFQGFPLSNMVHYLPPIPLYPTPNPSTSQTSPALAEGHIEEIHETQDYVPMVCESAAVLDEAAGDKARSSKHKLSPEAPEFVPAAVHFGDTWGINDNFESYGSSFDTENPSFMENATPRPRHRAKTSMQEYVPTEEPISWGIDESNINQTWDDALHDYSQKHPEVANAGGIVEEEPKDNIGWYESNYTGKWDSGPTEDDWNTTESNTRPCDENPPEPKDMCSASPDLNRKPNEYKGRFATKQKKGSSKAPPLDKKKPRWSAKDQKKSVNNRNNPCPAVTIIAPDPLSPKSHKQGATPGDHPSNYLEYTLPPIPGCAMPSAEKQAEIIYASASAAKALLPNPSVDTKQDSIQDLSTEWISNDCLRVKRTTDLPRSFSERSQGVGSSTTWGKRSTLA
ncbi:hypothetical protein FRC16_002058 [Serendipita sp. 398]|nr:hypothetical protein FRC16_002058 [Serendipita sp. 398]